ncbi:hypothetical protein PMAA_032820 [Talaromyces marneffei ATCC 18224]|uniref:Uncharacterized protein n=1 Tax=Talaromyces marneffei (strain ATCC 18224 / CBS 334.59 / QM 7333) TaxID=441960 RepID=B6Q5M1_TALMQ|nr:hypothetical protein PMAA_032820 [Talaromyces marneffei ATCC 18224]
MNSCLNSPHQRRRMRRQSREVNEILPIETYLYRCDPYRSSTVKHPWSYGVKVLEYPSIRSLILTYKNDIRDTFIKHGFPADGSGVKLNFAVKRVSPRGQPASTVLSIGIENDPVSNRDLSAVRDAIRDLLLSRSLKTVHVDIYDCDRRFFPRRFNIPGDHPAAIRYNELKGDIMRLLRKHIDLPWQSVCLHQVGRSLGQATPCIVLCVAPGAIYNWASLRRQILNMLGFADIEVEFLPEIIKKKQSTESRV